MWEWWKLVFWGLAESLKLTSQGQHTPNHINHWTSLASTHIVMPRHDVWALTGAPPDAPLISLLASQCGLLMLCVGSACLLQWHRMWLFAGHFEPARARGHEIAPILSSFAFNLSVSCALCLSCLVCTAKHCWQLSFKLNKMLMLQACDYFLRRNIRHHKLCMVPHQTLTIVIVLWDFSWIIIHTWGLWW